MSIVRTVDIKCPRCGIEVPTTVWNSVNVSLDPEAKERLLAGKLNLFHCAVCGYDTQIGANLLYHDMEREYIAQFYPFGDTESEEFLSAFGGDGQSDVGGVGFDDAPAYYKNQQLVFSMDELVRYVVFRDRLYEHHKTAGLDTGEEG
jgi:hypothetical protein